MFAYRYLLRAGAAGRTVSTSTCPGSSRPRSGPWPDSGYAVVFTYVLSTNAHFAAQFTPFMLTGLGLAFHSTGHRELREPLRQQPVDRVAERHPAC